jgi:surface protein
MILNFNPQNRANSKVIPIAEFEHSGRRRRSQRSCRCLRPLGIAAAVVSAIALVYAILDTDPTPSPTSSPTPINVKCPQTGAVFTNKTHLQTALYEWGYNASSQIDATAKYGPISTWGTSNVESFRSLFSTMEMQFNGNIGCWDTSQVTDMSLAFQHNSIFDQDIGAWNTAAVTTMQQMFYFAAAFNYDIGGWNTAAVTNMELMFSSAVAFNQAIGSWNTGNVTAMTGMFYQAPVFNQDIGNWNTAAVKDMGIMFREASAFNCDLGSWNTAAVKDIRNMFQGASVFNQDISSWDNTKLSSYGGQPGSNDMVDSSGMSCLNFKALRCAWNVTANDLASNVSANPGNCNHTAACGL